VPAMVAVLPCAARRGAIERHNRTKAQLERRQKILENFDIANSQVALRAAIGPYRRDLRGTNRREHTGHF
jgi:hypothetical protein